MSALPIAHDVWLPTRRSLLERLRSDNANADWQVFFDTYWRLIYRSAAAAGLKPDECEDVVQETVLAVFKKLPDFEYKPEVGHFKGWLYNLTRWKIKDFKRGQRRRERLFNDTPLDEALKIPCMSDSDILPEWEQDWETNLKEVAMDRLRNQVDPTYYQVFQLSDIKGWKGLQVARSLKVTLTFVYTAKHRVRKQLKQIIKQLHQHPEQFLRKYEKQ